MTIKKLKKDKQLKEGEIKKAKFQRNKGGYKSRQGFILGGLYFSILGQKRANTGEIRQRKESHGLLRDQTLNFLIAE